LAVLDLKVFKVSVDSKVQMATPQVFKAFKVFREELALKVFRVGKALLRLQ
jgi:hypothetical protein